MPKAPTTDAAVETAVAKKATKKAPAKAAETKAAPKKSTKKAVDTVVDSTSAVEAVPKKAPKKAAATKDTAAKAEKAPKAEKQVKEKKLNASATALNDAVALAIKFLQKNGRQTRSQLKEVAPFSNYTKLVRHLEEEGLAKEVKLEEDTYRHIELTAKGAKFSA